MAHADYNCCMICDCKMGYMGYYASETKAKPCETCLQRMRDAEVMFLSPGELINYLETLNMKEALTFLRKIGYEP